MKGIIAETCHYSQSLDAFPASRDVACGFFAASLLVCGQFLCKQATVVQSKLLQRHIHRRLAATKGGCPVNCPVMKRQPESR